MRNKFIISIDQGTTSCRTIIFDLQGKAVSSSQKEFQQIIPESGWVEHDAKEIWSVQYQTILEAIKKAQIDADDILTIGITNQRETTAIWRKSTGEPVYNAIVWQDNRTSKRCSKLAEGSQRDRIVSATGLIPDSYFSASKIEWILKNIVKPNNLPIEDLAFGTIDSWLLWNLTGGEVHATDYSNASRTMLFNINSLQWDKEMLTLFNIPSHILPEVKDSSTLFGYTVENLLDNVKIPISGILGDQQAALYGQDCFQIGMAKNTYGTGCFILANTGSKPFKSNHGLLTTIAWKTGKKVVYALEGSVFNAGSAINWFVDELGLAANVQETSGIAASIQGSDGVFVIPAFSGLGSPYWDMNSRAAILGLSRKHGKSHIIRALLESLAFRSADVLKAMEKDTGEKINKLKVDGGVCKNDFLLQFQADILGIEVCRPEFIETTALGAAKVAAHYFNELKESDNDTIHSFYPEMDKTMREKHYEDWLKAVKRILST
ncbi:MAG: glycerol kinase GlpK [Chitinophagales bacterium]|nr:glycerol kinase GlpK [Chitinophagales bacterium]